MDSNNAAIIIAILSAMTTIIGGSYATWQQLKKDDKQASIETGKLQEQIEETLWIRMQGEFDKMITKIDQLTAENEHLKQQRDVDRARIKQLEENEKRNSERIRALEKDRDDWKARALKAESGGGSRRV